MELESVPGVGPKTANSLQELDDPVQALLEGDVASVADAANVPTGRAVHLIRNAQRAAHGDRSEFLATDRGRELYQQLIEEIQQYAQTDTGAAKVATFYPSASVDRIEEAREIVEDAMAIEPDGTARDALTAVAPLEPPRSVKIRDRCLVTADPETVATARDVVPEMPIETVDDTRAIAELSRGYGTVVVLDATFAGMDLPSNVSVEPTALESPIELVPERSLAFIGHNRTQIEAAIEVHRAAGISPPCPLDEVTELIDGISRQGEITGDDELIRLQQACDDLDVAISTAESVANDQLKEAIERRNITVEGADLLTLAEQGARVESLLDRELEDERDEAIEAAIEHAMDALGLESDERADLEAVFSSRTTYPLERDDDAYDRLEASLQASRDDRLDRLTSERAAAIEDHRDAIETLIERSIQYDVEQAISRYARQNDCVLPTFVDEGLTIENGRPPGVPEDEVEAVTYEMEGVTLLTGVNSGGKTTLLDLLAAVVILAHMGLPVPAEQAEVQRFDRVFYHAKTQGTLDAGAFEATVQEFANLAQAETNSLILVDELESITEPGASAKLVSGFLEALSERDATAVFVTHLAMKIREEAAIDLAIDGIVAEGLDDGELIVDRSPRKDHLARSTPELIVERLADDSPDDPFYSRLLDKFD